ncbi:hypothetical protein PAEPH01_0310 [Pancytospora epiphaga]|nr:hypothetical protein PAEPH01_0310 [Pancytospora epiphaga]
MLIEAICRYNIRSSLADTTAIDRMFISPLVSPNYSNECLFVCNGSIQVFDGLVNGEKTQVILKYCLALPEDEYCYKRFVLTKAENNEIVNNGHFIILANCYYCIDTYTCTLKTIDVFFTNDTFEAVICVNTVKFESVISLLEKLKPEIEMKDSLYCMRKELHMNNTIYTRYILKCDTGDVYITSEAFEYLERLEAFEKIKLAQVSTVNTVVLIDSIITNTSYKVEYEYTNIPDYKLLIKSLIEGINLKNHSYITHFYINNQEPFFFTLFAICGSSEEMSLTVFMTRELLVLSLLFNSLSKDTVNLKDLMNIEYISRCNISVTVDSKELLLKYKLDKFEINTLVAFAYSEKSIILEDTPETFWLLMFALSRMEPLLWPGLVITPIRKTMLYLLEGPYTFLVSASSEVVAELENFVGHDQYYSATSIQRSTGMDKPPILDASMESYLFHLQSRKLQSDYTFPLRFNLKGLRRIEVVYLQSSSNNVCNYVYDSLKGIVFLPRVYIDDEDPLPLWVLISPLEIDYEALMSHCIDLLPFLVKRACIDEEGEILFNLLNEAKEFETKILNTTLQAVCNYARSNVYKSFFDFEPEKITIVNTCACFRVKSGEKCICKLRRFHKNCIVTERYCLESSCRKYTSVIAGETEVSLISVSNLIALFDVGYLSVQVRLSIFAYFYYYNLPITEISKPYTAECHFEIKEVILDL